MQVIRSKSRDRAADMRFSILILQVITILIILIIAILLRSFGGDIYNSVSGWYRENFNDITTVDEVIEPQNIKTQNIYEKETSLVEDESFEEDLFADEFKNDEIEISVNGYLSQQETTLAKPVSITDVNTISWPVQGKVTSEYGNRVHPITGVYGMHGGIDISAKKGTDINAVYNGKITKVAYSNSYGNYVIITHSDNMSTLYAHCSKVLVREDDEVVKGDVVALVGSTGRSTGSHLHFEIRIGGFRVDPRWLLPQVADV